MSVSVKYDNIATMTIEELRYNLSNMCDLYRAINDVYQKLPERQSEWVDDNWFSMVNKWADDLKESAESSTNDEQTIECGKCDHDHASEEECTAAEPNNITQRCYDELKNFLYQDKVACKRYFDDDLDFEEEIGYLVDDADLSDVDYEWIKKEVAMLVLAVPNDSDDEDSDDDDDSQDKPKEHTCVKNGICHIYMATELEFRMNYHKHKGFCSEHWDSDEGEYKY